MPAVLTETIPAQAPLEPPRKKWTREECEKLELYGLLDGQHLELVEGELINKTGKKRAHVNTLSLVVAWLMQVFGAAFVNPEAPIDVSPEDNPTNEPEPDAIVLKRKSSEFVSGNPRPEDLYLVVEIADASLQMDLTTKAALYARAEIVEYWVFDVTGKRLIVHRNPEFGRYNSVVVCQRQENVSPLAAPEAELRVGDVFVG